LLASADTR